MNIRVALDASKAAQKASGVTCSKDGKTVIFSTLNSILSHTIVGMWW